MAANAAALAYVSAGDATAWYFAGWAVTYPIMEFATGAAQWVVLQVWLRSWQTLLWMPVTFVGGLFAYVLAAIFLGAIAHPLATVAVLLGVGVLVGACQWPVLQGHVARSAWGWLVASAVGWALLLVIWENRPVRFLYPGPAAAVGAAAGAAYGLVTGMALLWLLRTGRDSDRPAQAEA